MPLGYLVLCGFDPLVFVFDFVCRDLSLDLINGLIRMWLMVLLFQVCMVASLMMILVGRSFGEGRLKVPYEGAVIEEAMFMRGVSMLGREQDEYATRLVANAVWLIQQAEGEGDSVRKAERMIGVALHLSPKNRAAEVVVRSLEKGEIPELVKGVEYYGKVFARLLMVRAGILINGGTERDVVLGRCFLSLAMELDPGSEDLRKQLNDSVENFGVLNWNWVMGREPK